MCFQRELYTKFVEYKGGMCQVKVGDGRKLEVVGVGDVKVQVVDERGAGGVIHTIKDVLLVPDLDRNFLSVLKVTEKGMKVIFEEGADRVLFMKGDEVVVSGVRDNKLYKMNLSPIKNAFLNVASSGSMMLWHERLGHVNFKTLQEMCKNGVVQELKLENVQNEIPFCDGCAYGKQHRHSFPKSGAKRASMPGETFHADLCGKMSMPSVGKSNYFLLLKDDYSRFCFVYFLKDKTDVLKCLMEFFAEVQADGHVVKRLRTDGGLEFCNDDVNKFLLKQNVKHEVTTPRAPEQNGFVERQNRTVVESAKAMIHKRRLQINLWAEATNTAVYLKNRTASEVLNGRTPYELWYGVKPAVSHLRVFGCEAYVHIPKEQRTKWDKNSVKGIMVGYNDDSKAYRIYDPIGKKVFIRRDVIFNERQQELHDIVEIKEKTSREQKEEETGDADVNKSPKIYKNPREPVPRSPYSTRSGAKKQSDKKEEIDAELCIAELEPTSLEDALADVDSNKWLAAIHEEIDSLNKNQTWNLVPRTSDMHVLSNQWIFKRKYKANGEIDKYKARLVVRGCFQKRGIDYNEIYSPVVRYESVRTILSIAAAQSMDIIQFDVKTAFLHGYIEENIFMEQPYGFKIDGRVCHLQKGLYGLKQASHQWNKRIVGFLTKFGFKQASADLCVFVYTSTTTTVYLTLYVDDGLICGNDNKFVQRLLQALHQEFEITHREAEFFVGLQINIDKERSKLKIFQNVYTQKILQRFNHSNCSTVRIPAEPGVQFLQQKEKSEVDFPYREAIGSLMYLVVCTRPDIAYIVCMLSRFVENPSDAHWQGVKRIFRYLQGTKNRGITFDIGSQSKSLVMYCDSDWAGDVNTRRSTTGWICFLNKGPIAWRSRKQTITATSTTEAEFIALCDAAKAVKLLRKLLADININQATTPIKCDNQRAITLVKNPESSKRTKHIDIQYFYTCDLQREGAIDVQYLETSKQIADILTKALSNEKFNNLLTYLED